MTRRQLLRLLAAAPALAVTGCTAQSASSQQEKPLILRYAENQPEDYPTSKAAKAFAELVAQRTDGRVKVLVYSGAELGAEQSVIQQMQFGGVDFSRVSLSQLAEYEPELSVLQLPYLYSDAQQMWRVLDGDIGDEFLAMLDGMDLVGLSWFDAGVRSFYTREKVTGLDDLQGLTIRVQESDMMSDMITALGAKPAQVVYSKVYAALHNAEIDGAENNWPSYEVMGHYEVAPFFLKDEHTRVPEVQLASPAVMEKLAALDESFPEVIRACARESAQTERELWARREANAEQNMRKRGLCVTELDEAEKARHALELHFDVSPLGIGWIGKAIGAPLMHLFTAMPQLPAVHKREFLCRQVMRSVMTFFWAAESHDLSVKLVESYDEWRIKWALTIPWHHIVVSVMLVGYSDRENKQVSLQSLDEQSLNDTVHWNKPS